MPQRYRGPISKERFNSPNLVGVRRVHAARRLPPKVLSYGELFDNWSPPNKRQRLPPDQPMVPPTASPEHISESDEHASQSDGRGSGSGDQCSEVTDATAWEPGNPPVPVQVDKVRGIPQLRNHLTSALDFINESGLAIAAPQDLCSLLMGRPRAARCMSMSVVKTIEEEYDRLSQEILDHNFTGTTSDDLSKAMYDILPSIELLANTSDPSESLVLAYRSLFSLKASSYGDLDGKTAGEGDRPSDEPADMLLADVIKKRLALGHRWDWKSDLEELSREAKNLMDYGIEPWYPRTRKALRMKVTSQG